MRTVGFAWVLGLSLLAGACGGGGGGGVCDPVAGSGCDDGLVCEPVQGGGDPVCATPVVIRGRVFDLADDSPIGGARVVALDVNGSPSSSVAVSGPDGTYELGLPIIRTVDGVPVEHDVTLRVEAEGFQTFPSGLRQALPIDTGQSAEVDGVLLIMNALTDVGLIALPGGAGTGSIHGTVQVPPSRAGILVVAETSSGPGSATGYSAIADKDGDYAIFNLPAGSYDVTAYALGVTYETVTAEVPDGGDVEVDLALSDAATGTLAGSIQIVNAPGGSMTSIILVVESTFVENLARGDAPPGLRAPPAPAPGNIAGDYTIEGVPPGRYVILAAFENDDLVRDPDTTIGGTATQHVEIVSGTTTTAESFKITEALEVFYPGAEAPEAITNATPTFRWADDSSEDSYELDVYDAFGNNVWDPPLLPGESGNDPMAVYAGAPLVPGMYYQFRVKSIKDGVPISATEDLRGVFFLAE